MNPYREPTPLREIPSAVTDPIGRRVGSIASAAVVTPITLFAWYLFVFELHDFVYWIPLEVTCCGLVTVLAAQRLGVHAARSVARRRKPSAIVQGVIAGLALLLVAACGAALTGLLDGAVDTIRFRLPFRIGEWLGDYGMKPFETVVFFGWIVAAIAGAISGAALERNIARAWSRLTDAPSIERIPGTP